MSTRTRLMTADELLWFDDPSVRVELVEGELITMTLPGGRHGRLGSKILRKLGNFVEEHRLGETYTAETGFLLRRAPDTVRGADVAFVSRARLEPLGDPVGHIPFAPDLVVEIVSPNDRPGRIAAKRDDWLEGGARLIWWVYPDRREVVVNRPGRDPETIGEAGELDGGEVVPGFRVRVAELFAAGGDL